MTTPRDMSLSRTYPVTVEDAFDRTLALPLPTLFRRRYGALPPIAEVRDQDGEWGTVGQTRTIVLQGPGGGSMVETLTLHDRPQAFGYRIGGITGPMKPLVSGVEGRWAFEAAGTGVRITWSWTVHPASGASARAMGAFARMWTGYARRAFEELEVALVP